MVDEITEIKIDKIIFFIFCLLFVFGREEELMEAFDRLDG